MESFTANQQIRGYLYLLVEKATINQPQQQITCHISLGAVAKCQTQSKSSEQTWNQAFLIQVPSEPSRLIMEFKQGENMIGECRYDVSPFFNHPGSAHSISSQILDSKNEAKGTTDIKIIYYSAEWGKLSIRIFNLSLDKLMNQFKSAKVKIRSGLFAKTSKQWQIGEDFDETFVILVLQNHGNLTFEVVQEQGILAAYTIYDIQKSNLLIQESKAYQVSLFNKQNSVGTIKYLVQWIKNQ